MEAGYETEKIGERFVSGISFMLPNLLLYGIFGHISIALGSSTVLQTGMGSQKAGKWSAWEIISKCCMIAVFSGL